MEKTLFFIQVAIIIVQSLSFIAMLFYVFKTWQIAKFNKKMTIAQASSSVIAYFDFPNSGFIVYLVIKNISIVPAYDIKISISPEIQVRSQKINLSDFSAFKNGISFLAPGQELKFQIDSYQSLVTKHNDQKNPQTEYDIKIEFKDSIDKSTHSNIIKLDLMQFYRETSTANYNEYIVNELKGIRSNLEKIQHSIVALADRNKNV